MMSRQHLTAIAYNESHVCDVALSPTRAKGRCGGAARCSAAEPEAPSWVPMHIRAVMRSCAVLSGCICLLDINFPFILKHPKQS